MVVPDGSTDPGGRLGAVRPSRVTFVVLLALLGVVLVAGITYAGSRLVSQPIGLAAEPHDLSSSLSAPAAATTTSKPASTRPATTKAPVTTAPRATAPPPASGPVTSTTPASTVPSARREGHDADGDDD